LLLSRGVPWLVDPFSTLYMQRALLELALLAVPAGALGAFVLLRRLAFFTHALGVGTFPGVVVAVGVGVSAFAGGLVSALLLALGLAALQRRRDLDPAAATGLLLAGALALGSLLVSNVFGSGAQVDTLLFGSLFGVTDGDLIRSGVVAAVVLVAVAVVWRGAIVVALDRETAPALGFRPARYDLILFVLLAVTVVAAVDAVGVLLVSSLFVVPAASARLLTRRVLPLAVGSSLLALVCAFVGLLVSFHTGSPPGASVAVVAAGVFLVSFVLRSLVEPRQRRRLAVAGAAVTVLLLAACGGSGSGGGVRGPIDVIATTTQVADWARHVGGRDVHVTELLEPLVDPHEFEPGPDQANAVSKAKLVVASGAGLDKWIESVASSVGGKDVVELAPLGRLLPSKSSSEGKYDPHYWNDPTNVVAAVKTLEHALANVDPGHSDDYAANARAYRAQVRALDARLMNEFGTVPADRRKMVTDHDAFAYLAHRYDLTIVGTAIPSTSTAAEPSARDTAALIDTIRRDHVHVIFSEASVDPKLVRQIAAATGARVDDSLYGDTLGPAGSDSATYLGMMRHNARHLLASFRSER
jgi:zinc/manganese transport system substrate-binding protein/manganese/iron transport system substrate-binding protein